MSSRLAFAWLWLCVTLVPALADDAAMAARIAREFVVPRYVALAAAAADERRAWYAFCKFPSENGLEAARRSWGATADAWSSIELIRYGPVSEDFRAERISYWPERKNATGRGLSQLLSGTGEQGLSPERLRGASVAVQGLPALERLLFGEGAVVPADFGGSPEGIRRCAVGRAIADNLAALTAEIRDGWSQARLAGFSDADTAKEAVRRFSTDLLTSLQVMRDVKVLPVLGKDAGQAKPKLAEGWRSARPARALALNLAAAEELAGMMLEGQGEEDRSALYSLRQARGMAEALPDDFGPLAADPAQRHRLILLFDALGFARDRLLVEVPAALGISLGFNSLDGD